MDKPCTVCIQFIGTNIKNLYTIQLVNCSIFIVDIHILKNRKSHCIDTHIHLKHQLTLYKVWQFNYLQRGFSYTTCMGNVTYPLCQAFKHFDIPCGEPVVMEGLFPSDGFSDEKSKVCDI